MALTLLRHAALSPQHQGRYNGWTDISIDPTLYEEHKVTLLKTQHFDKIYCSDLKRTQETLEAMGMETYIKDERLREVRFKIHIEGLHFDEVRKLASFDERYLESQERWYRYICAENPAQFERRIQQFLTELPKDQEILICSHGGTLQKILSFCGYNKAHINYLEWIRIENGLQ